MRILFAFVCLTVVVAGCDCGSPVRRCSSSSECTAGLVCIDGTCTSPLDGGLDAGRDAAASDSGCAMGERACGGACCTAAEVCGTDLECCPRAELCGSTCCNTGEVCDGALCRIDCGTNVRCRDAAGTEVCCDAGEVCASGSCFLPVTPCEDFVDCAVGEYCEPSLGRCLPQPTGDECVARPTGGAVMPTLLWHWNGTGAALPTHVQVMMTPLVAPMSDDDGDGDIDADDVPDVIFTTFAGGNYTTDGVIRVVSGDDGSSVLDITDPSLRVSPGAQLAIGDLDGDGRNEIVACGSAPGGIGNLIAFHADGTLYWRSTDARAVCGMAAPLLADLDADGMPEVVVHYTSVDGRSGAVEWHHDCVGTGGWATSSHSPCDYTTAADLDGDGRLEVVGGNVAYRADGSIYYDHTTEFLDGYPSIGDLNRDGMPEVVVVHSAFTPAPYAGEHYLRAFRSDGTVLWGPVDLNAGRATPADVTAGTIGGGGPPTIANFDGDPEPEIAAAGAYAYAVFEGDGTVRWSSISDDRSSRKTGSSVFDFDGDGIAEVVYNDHYWLRVYDGPTGNVNFCLCNTTATLWEYPVVADVDNDLHAEIVIASNDYAPAWATCPMTADLGTCEIGRIMAGDNLGTHGVRVFASPTRDWVRTRRIWNQHTYHVTNVSETGSIPAGERPNWSSTGLNNFRLNVQPGATNLADLVPIDLAVDLSECTTRMTLNFRVENRGWGAVPPGAVVAVYVEDMGSFVLVARVTTTRLLLPGESEPFEVPYDLGTRGAETIRFRVIANDDGDPGMADVVECRPENNTAETTASCLVLE
jgi:hypothetical protein